MSDRVKNALPYALLLIGATGFYLLAQQIQYDARPGQWGPDLWPKLAIGLIVVVCLFELLRAFFSDNRVEAVGITEQLEQNEPVEDEAPRRPILLIAGVALTIAYGLLVNPLGFPLTTFLFLVAFMYVGGYRSHGVILLSSLIGAIAFTVVFLRIVYVSLPRGTPPFDRITDLLTNSI